MKRPIIQRLRHWSFWLRIVVRGAASAAIIVAASNALAVEIAGSALQQISALQAEKASRTPAEQKMDSQLIYALKQSLGQSIVAGVTNLRLQFHAESDGRVKVDIKATVTQDLLNFIQNSGGSVLSSVPSFHAVRALVPLSLTERLAERSDVQFVKAAVPAISRTGSVDSEGDKTHRAAEARKAFSVYGLGVNVGVLSTSVDYMPEAVATGDLPPNVTVLPGQSGVPGSGEGTAMLEIVYDLAPGARLFYATGFGGEASFAQNILDLRAAGCDIIVDDIGYFDESPFQDGMVAQAVNSVTADGALYFSAAGNEGNLTHGTSGTWEGDFADGGAAGPPVNGKSGTLHSFGANAYDTVTGVGNATVLLWSDPLGASTNDYDLYILDSTGTTVVSASTTVQNGSQDPFEIVPPPNVGERVVVVRATGDARFLHIDTIRGQLAVGTAGNITGHATATNAFACAAEDIHTAYPGPFLGGPSEPVEYFSSDGPRRVFFNVDGTAITPTNFLSTGGFVRQKPDITAADGVSTTLPPYSGLNPFYGTSAAAPHAAAVAALLKSYNPDLTPSQMRSILTSTALDIEAPGYDINSGYGIVMAYQAIQAAPPPKVSRLLLITNVISGGNGNGIIEFNECNNLDLVLLNSGLSDATGISATLFTATPGVAVAQANSTFADISAGGSGMNVVPFKVSTAPTFVCGTSIDFSLLLRTDQGVITLPFSIPTGLPGNPLRFDNNALVPIPSPGTTSSTVVVSGVNAAINKVTVSMYVTEPFDYFLSLALIAPDGTTNLLTANNGMLGANYGAACGPDSQRTTFDDAGLTPIASGAAPFVGTYVPTEPLSIYSGKSGTNVNGIWQLVATDSGQFDQAAIQCWSLLLTPTLCTDGGGQCPGADMAVGMTAEPSPFIVGKNLTYHIGVTNLGPSPAASAIVTHLLPTNVTLVAVTTSQGAYAQQSNVVTFTLGPMGIRAAAAISVVVQPTSPGTMISTATVSSEQPDFSGGNNSAAVTSVVTPATADVSVGIAAVPNPVLIGGNLIYTVSVTNNGPSPATSIGVTNVLPMSAQVQSTSVSAGTVSTIGNVVLWDMSQLAMEASATATITVTPTAEGIITASATVGATEFDPITANNSASVNTTVGPAADLGISLMASPNSVITGSNVTYVIAVTNPGPSMATGVIVSDLLPSAVNVLSTDATQGSISISNSFLTWNAGSLSSGANASLTIVAKTTSEGTLSTTATVIATQPDPNAANNTATVTTIVATPFISIVSAGAVLSRESGPTNGAIDVGETVTMVFYLRNAGNVSTMNLAATLLATNGVIPVPPNNPQFYGSLPPSGFPTGSNFTFTASGVSGGTISPTLLLQDGTNTYPPVSFSFTLPTTQVSANTNVILIPDPAAPNPPYGIGSGPAKPYPSLINVSNFTGVLGKVTVTLSNLNHSFPSDVNVLLVAPGGADALVLSHAGDVDQSTANLNLTFDDSAPAGPLPELGQLASGVWQPTAYTDATHPTPTFPTNAPAGPYPTTLSALNGLNPNGAWSLYVYDDSIGDVGAISNGWSLALSSIVPVNQIADLGVSAVTAPSPGLVGGTLTYTFTITNGGPNSATFVSFTNILPAGVTLVSAGTSRGTVVTTPGSVIVNLGTMNAGNVATVTNVVTLTSTAIPPGVTNGTVTSVAKVAALETDLNPVNSTISVIAAVSRLVADLGLTQVVAPDPVVVGYSLTNTVVITNRGPRDAALVVLTEPLPPGAGFVAASSSSTAGSITSHSGTVTCSLGDLALGTSATVVIVLTNSAPGRMTNTVTLSSGSYDPNASNNRSSYAATVVNPSPEVVNAGAVLTYESGPVNGVIDPGETVTLSLALANTGTLDISDLTATLLASGGVTTPSGSQEYGVLSYGGPSTSRSFTFKAASDLGGGVVATLQLMDGTVNLGVITFSFGSGAATNVFSSAAITIPDHGMAAPYPSTINISGVSGRVSSLTLGLNGLTHSFPHDVSVLLVSPSGSNVMVMSHAGGAYAVTNVSLVFDDAATVSLPNFGLITNGTYKPSRYEEPVALPGTAPLTSYNYALSGMKWSNPNGAWSLYVYDDKVGDAGSIASGWSLNLNTLVTVGPVVDLAVGLTVPAALNVGSRLTNNISIVNIGPDAATGVVLTNRLPAGAQFVSASLSQGNLNSSGGGLVTCNLGNLAAGGSAQVVIVTVPSAAGTLVNAVGVTGSEEDLVSANNTAQAVTIVSMPATLSGSLSSGHFQLTVTGQPNTMYVVQASTNLTSWVSLSTNTSPTGTFIFTDTNMPAPQQRFYRTFRP